MPRGRGSTRRILKGRRTAVNQNEIVRILYQEVSSDDGDFSAGSDDEYDPDRDVNKPDSSDFDSSSTISNDAPPEPGVELPSCDPEFQWSTGSARPQRFAFLGEPGIKTNLCLTPPALADIFFSNDFVDSLVQATNTYAHKTVRPLQKYARFRQWKDTNYQEMRRFIGMLLYMGLMQLPTISHYWRTDQLYNLPLFRSIMSRNRFQLLLRNFHFSENDDTATSRLHKINPILERFNTLMPELYYPETDLSIDESIVLWRGRLIFRQYIKKQKA